MRREDFYIVENNQLVLNREYLRGIPEFKCILERDIRVKGDADGRRKAEHWRIFFYIKLRADMFCFPAQEGLSDKEAHKESIKAAGLAENYKPDDEVLAAIEWYKKHQVDHLPVLKTIATVLKATKFSDTICQRIIESMEGMLDRYNKKIKEQEASGETLNIADNILLVNGLIDQLGQVQKIATTIPKTQELLEKLDERLKKESSGDVVGRGGKKIGNRADPK